MHRSKWCNRKRSVGGTAHVIAPASKFSHCRSFSHLFLFTILPVKRTQETRNIHSSTLLSMSMATKGCGIFSISFSCPRSRSWTHRIVAGHRTTLHHFSGNWPPISTRQGWKPSIGFQQNRHLEIGAQFEPGTGGIEPPTFCLQAWAPTHYATFGWPAHPYKRVCYIATPARPPKSKIQNPNGPVWILDFGVPFGFWSLEFGFWILDFGSWILDLGFWILDFGFWISVFGFWIVVVSVLYVAAPNAAVWILDFGFWILDFGFWILDLGFWILDFGFRILDFGFWILDFGFWILDFGIWILDFGSWILDFGSWILDLGFWISDFGFRILDFGFRQRFGFCIRLLLLHADSGRRIPIASNLAQTELVATRCCVSCVFFTISGAGNELL